VIVRAAAFGALMLGVLFLRERPAEGPRTGMSRRGGGQRSDAEGGCRLDGLLMVIGAAPFAAEALVVAVYG
jgi:hypothetical protein